MLFFIKIFYISYSDGIELFVMILAQLIIELNVFTQINITQRATSNNCFIIKNKITNLIIWFKL
jgi:hypothetical protein